MALSSSAFLGDLCVHCFAPDNFDHHYLTPHDNNDHPVNMASLLGSDADDCQAAFYAKPDGAVFVPIETLMSYLSQSELAGDVDIMEIWGGASGVSKVSLRRKLRTGRSFDLITGVDLTNPTERSAVMNYVRGHRP